MKYNLILLVFFSFILISYAFNFFNYNGHKVRCETENPIKEKNKTCYKTNQRKDFVRTDWSNLFLICVLFA